MPNPTAEGSPSDHEVERAEETSEKGVESLAVEPGVEGPEGYGESVGDENSLHQQDEEEGGELQRRFPWGDGFRILCLEAEFANLCETLIRRYTDSLQDYAN